MRDAFRSPWMDDFCGFAFWTGVEQLTLARYCWIDGGWKHVFSPSVDWGVRVLFGPEAMCSTYYYCYCFRAGGLIVIYAAAVCIISEELKSQHSVHSGGISITIPHKQVFIQTNFTKSHWNVVDSGTCDMINSTQWLWPQNWHRIGAVAVYIVHRSGNWGPKCKQHACHTDWLQSWVFNTNTWTMHGKFTGVLNINQYQSAFVRAIRCLPNFLLYSILRCSSRQIANSLRALCTGNMSPKIRPV